jgi:hypothetical protein
MYIDTCIDMHIELIYLTRACPASEEGGRAKSSYGTIDTDQ